MRRSYKKPKVKRIKIPRPVAPPKPERPKRGELKSIYKDLLTTDINQRVNTLARAMAWYDKVQAYLAYKQNGKFTTKQLRMKNRAEEQREAGIRSTNSIYKESAFQGTVYDYEVMVNGFKPPKLTPVLRKLKSSKSSLQEHRNNMQKKHGKFLQLLNQALNVKLEVDKLASQYRIGDNKVILDRKYVTDLRKLTRKHGLLSAVEELLPILSAAKARHPEINNSGLKTGRWKINYGDRYQAVLELIHALNNYAQKEYAVRSIVRRKHVSTTQTPQP